jgi:hypothetical protein
MGYKLYHRAYFRQDKERRNIYQYFSLTETHVTTKGGTIKHLNKLNFIVHPLSALIASTLLVPTPHKY